MSLFRIPGEVSSSSDGTENRDDGANASQEDLDQLSRINTINSTSASEQSGRQTPLLTRPDMSRDDNRVRDLVLHSLLEDKALREAAAHLGKDVSDPEVQARGREMYKALSRQLSGSNNVDESFASDEMRPHRAAAQEGIQAATRVHLTGLPATAATGDSLALIPQNMPLPMSDLFSSPLRRLLQNYSGVQTDRYVREFIELELVGKGGYGKVYKVRHKLDNSVYAIKRIKVSTARLQRIHENTPQEMENLLQEVRALAQFDNVNIVRYHNAWLEFTPGTPGVSIPMSTPSAFQRRRFIQDASSFSTSFGEVGELSAKFSDISFGGQFSAHSQDYNDIVFENSNTDVVAEDEDEAGNPSLHTLDRTSTGRNRRASQASHMTNATIPSTQSGRGTVETDNSEDDEDVETIPRTHHPHSQEPTSDFSESMLSNSDAPHLVSQRIAGPILTLNVQMSLYDTSLEAFLSPDQPCFSTNPDIRHCFHPCITLELLTHILSGVQYLHGKRVVHRDLKPANIFISLSTDRLPPPGSVDLCTCHKCPSFGSAVRTAQHITPRIGDFGLVAALGDNYLVPTPETAPKPVGTEFYRPPRGGSVSEKLDVFALGIVAFEMLSKFNTRSERVHALMGFRRGEFPGGFAESMGECGEKVRELLQGMVHGNEQERLGCEDVRREVEELVKALRR